MFTILHRRWGLLAVVALLAGTTESRAEGPHHFDIVNATPYTFRLKDWKARCVQGYGNSVNWPSTIAPGQTYTVNWEDSNNIDDYGGYGCVNKDKFVAISFTLDGIDYQYPQYSGYIGITHRRLSGDTWYNGQFYADWISINNQNGTINGSDGAAPPDWIHAGCSHNDNCFGPWSQMEMDNKNSYNWPRSYQTEDGWVFSVTKPEDTGSSGNNGNNGNNGHRFGGGNGP